MVEYWMEMEVTSKVVLGPWLLILSVKSKVDDFYPSDAAFAWIDVAKNCITFVTDPRGSDALNTWINASEIFNEAMQRDDREEAFRLFYVCNDSFKDAAPFIGKCELSSYFRRVYREFGAVIDMRNMTQINQYMIGAFPQFKAKLGC